MVLRKRAPPHLQNLSQGNARLESRSSFSRTSPTSFSVSSPSPKRLNRPSRAQSSPHPRRIPSQESVYSPDLNTSPAFDLMSLEQAQRSPIRTSSTGTPNPWADELVEKPSPSQHADPTQQPNTDSDIRDGEGADNKKGDRVPPIVLAGTQRRMTANEDQTNQGSMDTSDWEYLSQSALQLQSNNPFLKSAQLEKNSWDDRTSTSRASHRSSHSRDDASGLGQDEGYIKMVARLSLFDQQPESESPWANEPSLSTTQHPQSQGRETAGQHDGITAINHPQESDVDGVGHTPPQPEPQQLPPRINSPGTIPTATTASSHILIDSDESLETQIGSDANAAAATIRNGERHSAVQSVQFGSAASLREPNPSTEPAVPTDFPHSRSGALSEDDTKHHEKRSETYSIRHISWQDSTETLRESPVLIQNKNGPCPLLALVNALVLRAAGQSSPPPIVRALRTREQISLGLLIEALFDELTTRLGPDEELPDIEALSRFLTMLHTGMNVNPRLTLEFNDLAGTFLQTGDIKLYSTFGVPLVHGWIASPSTEANAALERIGQYHEDTQLLPFRRQELEDRVYQGAALTTEEERLMGDIQAIQRFTDVENATQLSHFGLEHLKRTMLPGSLSILFRNDHFSTLYQHPQLHQLFTLVTDAGYSSHAEVVWESLVDVNGSNTGYYAGDFRVVSQHTPRDSDPSGPRTSSNDASRQPATLSAQEQADADYAYALSLQYQEEEQRGREAGHSRSASASAANLGSGPSRPSQQGHSYGRHSQSHFESSGPRHEDPDDGPPPSYEQAAKSPAYPLPRRNPGIIDAPPRSPYQRNQYGRYPERGKDRGKDCIVM